MKNRFIILIDFSDYSANQIRFAKKWSSATDGEIILVHHTTPLIPTMTDEKSKEEIRTQTNRNAREELIRLATQTVEDTRNFGYLASDKDIEVILKDLFKEQNCNNILLIGLRGTNNAIRKILMGSFALKMIENSHNIIAALPKDIRELEDNSIFVAVNKQYEVNLKYFDKLLATFGDAVPTLKLFSVIKKEEDLGEAQAYLDELEKLYKHRAVIKQYIIEGDDVLTETKSLLENHPHNLLVIQKGSRLLADKIFRRFLINDLIHEARIPLVILP